MSDYSELKRVASLAKNWSGEIGEDEWYTACCFDKPKFSVPDAEFIAKCEPGSVLALIAEVEALSTQVRLAGVSAELTVHQQVGRAITEVASVAIERDQLKAEVETLTAAAQALRDEWRKDQAEVERLKHQVSAGSAREWDLRSQVRSARETRAHIVLSNKSLRGQVETLVEWQANALNDAEALRKDAERYRWLRVNDFDIGSYHPEGDNNHESWFEHFDDQSIDRGIADEAEFAAEAMGRDEIPDFTPGNGNKARRRADELGIDYDAAMSKGSKP